MEEIVNKNHLCSNVEKNCISTYKKAFSYMFEKYSTEKAFYQCHFNDFMYEFILMENEVNEKEKKKNKKSKNFKSKTPLNVLNYTIFQTLSSSLLP